MTVTEIAILPLISGNVDPEFIVTLKGGLDIQNDWHIAHFPLLPTTLAGRASHCLQQVEDQGKILITAKWESLDAHWKWIRSPENAKVMAALGPYVPSSPIDMVLLHVDGVIFGEEPAVPSGEAIALLDSPVISVDRFFVDKKSEEEFLGNISANKAVMEKGAAPYLVKGGWRVDVESEDLLEYVLGGGWESVEKHMKFSQAPEASRLSDIKGIARGVDCKHYKRIL
jgi:hypothetical protein